jgi:hypothetical protein
LREREPDGRFDDVAKGLDDFQLCTRVFCSPKATSILIAATIEDEDLAPRLQAKHVNEMVRLLFGKAYE